ncbi:DUF1549 and DUF1553 domain-containing protein [Planctomyces sp. SH-PL62]|uniref:DUF1549 and DUF1553 domain-containing protein n=1 Tax=Planctomyces sp. SH-PL62 TaxID=1636152 RepID=UPI00078C326E|nr:DUF1549 and DUF1553 domain-containing protein [Planctomyces sp. SH-PL62]AMV38969.1 Bacterial Ig-like domain (group 2) [Planctomyces sp. SH-PL62]
MPRRRVGSMIATCVLAAHVGCGRSAPPVVETGRPPSRPAETVAAPASRTIQIDPTTFTIAGDAPGLQLLATEFRADSTARDAPSGLSWRVEPAGIATVDAGGYVRPLVAGTVEVVASADGVESRARVVVEPRAGRSWDFARDVEPILTKGGCNTGNCHGRAEGQSGFPLSLYGYDPDADFLAITRGAAQRRIAPIAPERSLVVLKATGEAPHGGGRRLSVGSSDYETLVAWIRAGAPRSLGEPAAALVKLTIEPPASAMSGPGVRQLRVVAEYADGRRRDATRQAVFKSLDDSTAVVDPQGRAELLRRGEADLVVRLGTLVETVRLSSPLNPDLAFDFASLPRSNLIDDALFRRLETLKVPPSPPASDAAFLRRLTLDLTGGPPSPEEIRRFLADPDPEKRGKLVDRLLERPEFVQFWRIKLGDLLQISAARQGNGAYRYQEWLDARLAENAPWDGVVRTLLTALGNPNDLEAGGPVNYAIDALEPTVAAEQTAQRFLGLRLRCAQCHDHPFDVWTQDDYYGFAAFFAKVKQTGRGMGGMMSSRVEIGVDPQGEVKHLRTGEPVPPRLLDGRATTIAEDADPRVALAAWITSPENPYFARATANWVWAQLFGKGLVDPPDDMSRSNPPVHPELLDALAARFVATKFDLRELIRTVAASQAYGLSSAPVTGNEKDARWFSHQSPRPLSAHQMADALAQATDVPNRFPGASPTRRAIRVTDPGVASAILDAFGRCPRTTACASVQTPPLSLRQSLLLIGGDVVDSKVANLNGYLAAALALDLEPEELVENLYFRTLCRPPTPEESSRWSAELKQAGTLREAAEDLFWALLNSREFAFNH